MPGKQNQSILRIGDYVTFKNIKHSSLLCAEGILLEDLIVEENVKVLDDCLFCIHLQRQYSAARELEEFKQYNKDEKMPDANTARYFQALQRGSENENRLNDSYMKKKMGQVVLFGDIIQLFHVKSGKYLKVVSDLLAKDERENIRIVLDAAGNSFSWLQIMPRFKIDKEGDNILSSSEVYLKVAERSNEYIHRADRDPLPGHEREVNCSLEPTSWRLNIFQSSTDSIDRSLLLSSQLVYINDPETRCNLTVALQEVEALDGDIPDDKLDGHRDKAASNSHNGAGGRDNSVGGGTEVDRQSLGGSLDDGISALRDESQEGYKYRPAPLDLDDEEEPDLEEREFFHEYGDLILTPYTDYISSNSLWFVESMSLLTGGPIRLKSDKVRFKHMNTGLYLLCEVIEGYDEETEETSEQIIFTTTGDADEPGTLFSVLDLNTTGKFLRNAKAMQIVHGGFAYIERGDVLDNGNYIAKGTRDKDVALSLICNRFSSSVVSESEEERNASSTDGADETAADLMAAHDADETGNIKEPLDVYVGLAARGYLRKYHNMTKIPTHDSVNTVWPAANRTDMDFFKLVIKKMVFFAQGFPISSLDVQLGIDKADSGLRKRRQALLREQNTLEVILRIINRLIPATEKVDLYNNTPAKKRAIMSEAHQAMLDMGQMILSKCFLLLYYSILDNQENQMYVADFMPVLLAHLSCQPLAGKSVTEMLSKNLELQETKIGAREIQIFVDKLRSSKMNSMYLQLLQACCSCEGAGVDGNQCKVASMLFSDTNDIIINLHADPSHVSTVVWSQNRNSLYVPSTPIPGSPIRGDALISKGLPQLSLAWTTNSIDFSPLGLFGKLSVNVEELFRAKAMKDIAEDVKSSNIRRGKSKKKAMTEQKDAVAKYFIAEMFLGAEMCMDRNYVAMHKLDSLFPYEVLVSIMKMDVSTNLKSAAVRLLMCLHVDRDPQATSKIPLLTRTWTDIQKHTEPQLPYVDSGRRYTFGLIQQMISDHIRSMAGRPWDELSQHMLNMLRTLVQFNFYGTNDRMKDVIGPLVAALDRRQVSDGSGDLSEAAHSKNPINASGDSGAAEGASRSGELQRQADLRAMSPINSSSQQNNERTAHFKANMQESQDFDELDQLKDLAVDDQGDFNTGSSKNRSSRSMLQVTWQFIHDLLNFNNAARVIALLEDVTDEGKVVPFHSPTRYSKAPIYELETMVEAVDILAFAQHVIEDRNISLLLHYFNAWHGDLDSRSPQELFEQVVVDSRQLSLDIADFDNVMIDVLMFEHTPLTQSALEVLMAHHSMRRTLLDNAHNVQLLASHGRERQYKIVDQMLQQLEQNAETHELWGELETDADYAVNKQTKDILKELTDISRIRHYELEFDEDFKADPEIQDLYRNLGCFDICMKVMGLLDSVEEDEDGNLSEVAQNTRHLCLLCNTLLYWFLLGNLKNQEQGYGELGFFLDTLDDEINSHKVISAIFKNNESLMRQVPHSHLTDLVEKMSKNGRSHHYLALFASISHVGEKNIVENQFEIVKTLTSPGRLQKVAAYFCPVTHPDYEEKRALMEPYLNETRDLSFDDLPPLLAYHLMFLEVLSGCTVGRMNITTVEAKVQSVFNYVDILESILDPGTITIAKTRLCLFFYNSIIEVELKIPGLEQTPAVWQLLESFKPVLGNAKEELERANDLGWEHATVSRQRVEFILVCIMIVHGFFTHYYQPSIFQPDDREHKESKGNSKVHFSLTHVDELVVYFFSKIKEVHDLESPRLKLSMKQQIFDALVQLNKSVSGKQSIVPYIKPVQTVTSIEKAANEDDLEATIDPEAALIADYRDFLLSLSSNPSIQYKADNENVAFISILESLPFEADAVVSDVRYETLIRKLVSHIRENIKIVNNQKRLDARVTKTSTWIIRAFRTMIENRMGMSIYERDDEGGQEQDIACAPVVNALNSCGATALCLDLIADGIDEGLQLEAIKLGVGLLFKEGGALEVQGIMNNHLTKTNSELFFKQVRLTLQKLQAWHTWNETIILAEGQEPSPPDEILIVRFLQLMCEGHYLPNQDIVREQPNNAASFNLLDDFVNYLNCLSRIPCRTSSAAAIRLSATILEVIQGPCEGNQMHFALNTELIETLNRLNRAKIVHDCIPEDEIELKKTSIDIFQGLLEGQGENSPVYERVLSVIHLDIIQIMSQVPTIGVGGSDEPPLPEDLLEDQEILQTECVVLLQMLCNFKPSLYDELGISRNIEDIVGSGTAMIEVIWRGDIHRRFFHVPGICDFLAKSSKDTLLMEVDRSNAENKLIDFLNRSHDLYREVKHQQLLTELGISGVFSRTNQDRATWVTFILACVINLLLLIFYNAGDISQTERLPDSAILSISVLNLIQAVVSFFVLVLYLVVRIPVKYQSLMAEQKYSFVECVLYTSAEPMTMYYIWYLSFSILGQVVEYDFLPFLLMDIIVKNSTTKDVLNAVIFPRKQILMGGVVTLFIVQIYAFFIFLYFRTDIQEGHKFCNTLYGCYKVALGYGLRGGGGFGDIFEHTIAHRWWLDLTFFLVINVGMLNLVAGVIITTFGQLREDKARIMEDTISVCFICGIDKQVFDRASDEPEGFNTHVKVDHNMWNYLYFIFMLWEQDKDDDDGLEQYVRRAIDSNEITWFPLNKAIRLDQAASAEESLINDLKKNISKSEAGIANKLDKFQTEINIVLEQLNQTLKQDHLQERAESTRQASRNNQPHRKRADSDGKWLDASLDGMSVETMDDVPVRAIPVNSSKILMLELCELQGVQLPSGMDPEKVAIVITIDEGNKNKVSCIPVESSNGTLYKFSEYSSRIQLLSDAVANDERICEIEFIVEGDEFSVPLANVELPIIDLMLAEGSLFEVHFTMGGNNQNCILRVLADCTRRIGD